MLNTLQLKINQLVKQFVEIPTARKELLGQLTEFIQNQKQAGLPVRLNFICTHNSRRSHMAQLWALAGAHHYGIKNVLSYSGGTEATAFNPRAVKAMQDAGFRITKTKDGANPLYEVHYDEYELPAVVFSKVYDDPFNSVKDFAAVMTCSHADDNCPMVLGAIKRIALTYDDPKLFDGTSQETAKYAERVDQIGREILYAFSQVKI